MFIPNEKAWQGPQWAGPHKSAARANQRLKIKKENAIKPLVSPKGRAEASIFSR
jgi:hypothetical protein